MDTNAKNVFGQPRLRASLRDLRSPRKNYKSTIEDDLKKLIIMDNLGPEQDRDTGVRAWWPRAGMGEVMLPSLSPDFGICWPCWGVSEGLCYPQTEPRLKPTGKGPRLWVSHLSPRAQTGTQMFRAQEPQAGWVPVAQRQTKAAGTTVSLSPLPLPHCLAAVHGNQDRPPLGIVAHTCDPSPQETEAGESQVPGQPGLHD